MADFRRSTQRDMRNSGQKLRDKKRTLVVAALMAAAVVGFVLFGLSQARLKGVREDMRQMVQEQLDGAMTAYSCIDLRSSNVEGDILPTMRKHFDYAQALDNAVVILFGNRYETFDDAIFLRFQDAMSQYDQLNKRGQSTGAAREALDACMGELSKNLGALDARGNLVDK